MMKILAISLGTHDSGAAVLDNGQLVYWRTHTFSGVWSAEKLQSILIRFDRHITRFKIDRVVIKIPPATHHTKQFLRLLEKVRDLAQYRGCLVECYTKNDLKNVVEEIGNTDALIAYVTHVYPILLPEKERETKNRTPYHVKMFEAVLAAHVYWQSSKRQRC